MATVPEDPEGRAQVVHPLDAVDHDAHGADPHSRHSMEEQVLARIERDRRRRPKFMDEQITMAHGAGGKASRQLVEGIFIPKFHNEILDRLDDAALLQINGTRLAFTTDSFVVKPIIFPGGSIGELAVNGTVNDLAVCGAKPLAMSTGFILEEGLSGDVVRREVNAMAEAARRAGVDIVAGDTKVVERGKCDQMYINTSGIGTVVTAEALGSHRCRPGDKIIASGYIGDHGVAIMMVRGELELEAEVDSDTAPLWPVAEAIISAAGDGLRCMRDATRGGVATVLNEIAMEADLGVVIAEDRLPVRPEVMGASELLGIDVLYVANEGKLLAVVAPEAADAALEAIRGMPGCEPAAIIGEVRAEPPGRVLVKTGFGGHRMLDLLVGDPLPRIC